MINEPQYSTILTDLDCLFDTRLGTLVNIDKDLADKVFEEDKYFNRLEDSFLTLDKETFYSFYKRRNKLILANSPLTKVLQFVREFILGTLKNSINSPFKYDPKLILNLYPYRLNEEEKNKILQNLVFLTNEACTVELIDTPPLDISPIFLKKTIAVWLTYEYSEWLEKYAENKELQTNAIPDVTLMIPSLFFHHIPTSKERADYAKHGIDPFQALELLAKPMINLKVIRLETFCMDTVYYDNDEEEKSSTPSSEEDSVEETEVVNKENLENS